MLKKKIILLILGTVVSFILLEAGLQIGALFVRSDNLPRILKEDKTCKILCLGDSHTYGIGAKRGESYPDQLQDMLDRLLPGKFKIINQGVPGINTAILAARIGRLVDIYSPQIVIVMIGANDYWNLNDLFLDYSSPLNYLDVKLFKLRSYRLLKILYFNLLNKKPSVVLKSDSKSPWEWKKLRQKIGEDEFRKILYYASFFRKSLHFQIKKDYEKSLESLFKARCLDFMTNLVYLNLDELFIHWENDYETIGFYTYLKELFPQDAEIDLRLGRMYKKVRDYEKSKLYFNNVLKTRFKDQEAETGVANAEFFLSQSMNIDFFLPDEYNLDAYRKRLPYDEYLLDKLDKNIENKRTTFVFALNHIIDFYIHNKEKDPLMEKLLLSNDDFLLMRQLEYFYLNNVSENNSRQQNNLLDDKYLEKMNLIYNQAKKRHVRLFFMSYPNFVRKYMLEAVKINNAEFIDLRNDFNKVLNNFNWDQYFIADGHCNAAGYKIIAVCLKEKILTLFNYPH